MVISWKNRSIFENMVFHISIERNMEDKKDNSKEHKSSQTASEKECLGWLKNYMLN